MKALLAAAFLLLSPLAPARAAAIDMSIGTRDVTTKPPSAELVAQSVARVYIKVHNLGTEDAMATVSLYAGTAPAGQSGPVPVRGGTTVETWVDMVVPDQPFTLTAEVNADGDNHPGNNQVTTARYEVSPPAGGRDIFSPPPGRGNVSLSSTTAAEASSTAAEASSTMATSSASAPATAVPVEWSNPTPQPSARSQAYDDANRYTWIPYALILLGAIGFAWGMRGRRRQLAQQPALESAPAAAVAKPRRRPTRRRKAAPVPPAPALVKPARRRAPRRIPPISPKGTQPV